MAPLALLVFCVIMCGLALFQGLLAAGAPWGRFAWGGQHRVLPFRLRLGSVVSIGLYLAFMLVLGDHLGLLSWLPPGWSGTAAWLLVGYFAIGIVMNAISRSSAERYTMTPLAALLFVCCLMIATA